MFNINIIKMNDIILQKICNEGNLDEIKKNINKENINKIYSYCSNSTKLENIKLEIIKYLFSVQNIYTTISIHDIQMSFIKACFNCHIDIINYLISNISINYSFLSMYSAYKNNCVSDNIEIFKLFLNELYNNNFIEAFLDVCSYKQINLIKYLIDTIDDLKDFKSICENEMYLQCYGKDAFIIPLLLIQIKENKIEENKKIIKIEINDCIICNKKNIYFFEYKCDINHLICLDCLLLHYKCYYCNEIIDSSKLYINDNIKHHFFN